MNCLLAVNIFYTAVSSDYVSGQRRPWTQWMNLQTDLCLFAHIWHMALRPFSCMLYLWFYLNKNCYSWHLHLLYLVAKVKKLFWPGLVWLGVIGHWPQQSQVRPAQASPGHATKLEYVQLWLLIQVQSAQLHTIWSGSIIFSYFFHHCISEMDSLPYLNLEMPIFANRPFSQNANTEWQTVSLRSWSDDLFERFI